MAMVVPDLFEGCRFETVEDGTARAYEIGFEVIANRVVVGRSDLLREVADGATGE